MKYFLLFLIIIGVGYLVFHFKSASAPEEQLPAGVVLANWSQPQACPQYGGANECYVTEGAFGGYDNWAATRATFIWRVNPCPQGKTVTKITKASCVYETNGASGSASTTLDNGYAVVDCRPFASQYRNDACNCNNGITLHAQVECQ
jgi:hypothetical protein